MLVEQATTLALCVAFLLRGVAVPSRQLRLELREDSTFSR